MLLHVVWLYYYNAWLLWLHAASLQNANNTHNIIVYITIINYTNVSMYSNIKFETISFTISMELFHSEQSCYKHTQIT